MAYHNTRTQRIRDIIHKFKGGKRKLLELRIFNEGSDKWTRAQMAKHCGITTNTLYSYLGDTEFNDALIECTKMLYGIDMPTIGRRNIKLASEGDAKHAKMAFDLTNMIESGNRQTVNVAVDGSQADTGQEFESDADALAYIEATRKELNEIEASIRARGRLGGHGIHPDETGKGTEEE